MRNLRLGRRDRKYLCEAQRGNWGRTADQVGGSTELPVYTELDIYFGTLALFKHLDKLPFVKQCWNLFSTHTISACQPCAGPKTHVPKVALGQGMSGTANPHAPSLVSQHHHCNTMHLALHALPAAWCRIHGFGNLFYHSKQKACHKIACHLSLAWFSQIWGKWAKTRHHSRPFISSFTSLTCSFCPKVAVAPHMYNDGLSRLLYTYLCVRSHIQPSHWNWKNNIYIWKA